MNLIEANNINHNNRLGLIGKGNIARCYYNPNRRQFEAYDQSEKGNFIIYAIPDFTGWQDKHLRIKVQVQTEHTFKDYMIEYNPYEHHKWFIDLEETYGLFDLVSYIVKPKFQNQLRVIIEETFRMSYGFDNYGEKIFNE